MGRFRVRFTTPQRVADVMPSDALVSEVVVEADRLVLLRDDGVQVDVSPELVESAGAVVAEQSGASDADGRVGRPGKEGKPWEEAEVEALVEGFREGMTARELADRHGRTTGAIRSRLRLLGLV
jgi:hypothetical protein